jgi:DNA-binding NarL/FixJ family response regulator
LIVDDSRPIRSSLRSFLETRDDWVVCGEADNGRDGVDQALILNPDLILMDLSMPVMNGFQAARELKRLLPQTPILMLTTFDSTWLENEARASGINAVRSKSDGLELLSETMHALLEAA